MNACEITDLGLLGDRAYGVVDIETGKLANAKNPKKWPEMFQYLASFTAEPETTKPMPPVKITLPDGSSVNSTDQLVNKRLTDSFKRNVMLAAPTQSMTEFEIFTPEGIEELDNPGQVFSSASPKNTFFDSAMVHIITTATIDALGELAPTSRIEARRFRPNLIIDVPDEKGFVEESWIGSTITIGNDVKLKIIKPTSRCVMTTLAQGDLPNDMNVLRTLAQKNKGNFGVYAEVITTGRIRIGDAIEMEKADILEQ